MLEKPEGAIKNGQSRKTGNIGYQTQNIDKQPGQSRKTGNIEYKTKTNNQDNPEKLATLGTRHRI